MKDKYTLDDLLEGMEHVCIVVPNKPKLIVLSDGRIFIDGKETNDDQFIVKTLREIAYI